MNNGSMEADMIVRMSLQGMDYFLRISGAAAKHVLAMLMALKNKPNNSPGQLKLKEMLKSGKPSTVFDMPEEKLAEFAREAKLYGIQYVVVKQSDGNGVYDILSYVEDAAKINRICEKIGLGRVNETGAVLDTNVTEAEKQNAVSLSDEQHIMKDMASPNEAERKENPKAREASEKDSPSGDSLKDTAEAHRAVKTGMSLEDNAEMPEASETVNGRSSILSQLKNTGADMEASYDMFREARALKTALRTDAAMAAGMEHTEFNRGWVPPKEEYDADGSPLFRGKHVHEMTETDKVQYMVDTEMKQRGELSERTIKSLYEAGYKVSDRGIVSEMHTSFTSEERKVIANMMSEPARDRIREGKEAVSQTAEAFMEIKK